MTIKVALIDDQALVRSGISSLLRLSDKVTVIAEGDDGERAIPIANEFDPDIFLMDIRMPRVNGIQAIELLRDSDIDTPVLILTTFDDHELVLKGIKAGAQGYLLKDVSLESLVDAIETVIGGDTFIQPAITATLLKGLKTQTGEFASLPDPEALSPKEIEVLRLVASGYSNREISSALHKSEGTIKNHVSNVLAKLGVRDRTRAVLRALEVGII
ncbi:MAG: response regulator transcription factor [Gammaproteobacteria bacterium]|nr:response regulator transcription factor [Gammaproteobacteria bacterium]